MKVGSQHSVVIDSMASSGDGVGRLDGQVVFVPGACPGDQLRIQITLNKKTFLKAQILEILSPSPQRTPPPCPYFNDCGGCQWQNIEYNTQLNQKFANLKQTLLRIGDLDTDRSMEKVVASPETYYYRNRIQLHFDSRGPHYLRKGSHRPVYIDQCMIADPEINRFLKSRPPLKGKWELAVEEQGVRTYRVNEKGVSELGFRQVNNLQNQTLINRVQAIVAEPNIVEIFDLYCGQGNWSRKLAPLFPKKNFTGIDSNPTNIQIAKEKAPANCQYFEDDAIEFLNFSHTKPDLVILDPPRAGCSPQLLQQLNRLSLKALIYISCHPASLARDLKSLTASDFDLVSVVPVDMFPQTPHLETWCLLRSNKG